MKTIKFLATLVLVIFMSVNANATFYSLVSCQYKWIPEFSASKYVGTYKSSYGNLFTTYFDSYCPPTINQ